MGSNRHSNRPIPCRGLEMTDAADVRASTGAGEAPVRLAVIGAGVFAQSTHIPALALLKEKIEVVGVFSRSLQKARAACLRLGVPSKAFTAVDDLLSRQDIDAVDIAVPIPVLPDMVKRALQAGKHVISEKPIATSPQEAQTLIDFYRARPHPRPLWMVAENFRYKSAVHRARDIIQQGQIGQPICAHVSNYVTMAPDRNPYYRTTWRRDGSFEGGLLLDGGVHYVALLRALFGRIRRVFALTRRVAADLKPCDTMACVFEFASGLAATYSVTYAAGVAAPQTVTVVGDRGTLEISPYTGLNLVRIDGSRDEESTADSGVKEELAAFIEAIRTGKPHLNSPEEAFHDLAGIDAALRSAQTGAVCVPVELSDLHPG